MGKKGRLSKEKKLFKKRMEEYKVIDATANIGTREEAFEYIKHHPFISCDLSKCYEKADTLKWRPPKKEEEKGRFFFICQKHTNEEAELYKKLKEKK